MHLNGSLQFYGKVRAALDWLKCAAIGSFSLKITLILNGIDPSVAKMDITLINPRYCLFLLTKYVQSFNGRSG